LDHETPRFGVKIKKCLKAPTREAKAEFVTCAPVAPKLVPTMCKTEPTKIRKKNPEKIRDKF